MASAVESDVLQELYRRLVDEEASYASALASLDQLAAFPLPEETAPEIREFLEELNGLWPVALRPEGSGFRAAFDRRTFDALAPLIHRQAQFNAVLVRLLNAHLEHGARHNARLREMSEGLVRFAQRVEPVMDARDQMRVARAPTRAEQVLEIFGTHERPLHPETLRFLAVAAGFGEVRIEMRSPVPDDVRLQLLPGGGLPPPVVRALNENVERLNALLFAPLEYALVARR